MPFEATVGDDARFAWPLRPARLRTYHDHRMAMFAAVVGAVVPGVLVEDVDTTAKTYPGFDQVWRTAVGGLAGPRGIPVSAEGEEAR